MLSYEGFIDLVRMLQNLEADNINAVMRLEWVHDTIKKAVFCKSNPYHDEKGRFASRESLYIKTAEKAHSLFPNEVWIKYSDNIFIAESRKKQGDKSKAEHQKLEKELEQAKILAGHGHIVCMLPEIKDDKKHPDAVVDGILTEFKEITGGENAISHRFRESLHQGSNVFLKIDSDININRVKKLLKGVLKDKNIDGVVYVYLSKNAKIYRWQMKVLK